MVAQISTKKPLYKKTLEKLGGEFPNADCEAPTLGAQTAARDFLPTGGEQLSRGSQRPLCRSDTRHARRRMT